MPSSCLCADQAIGRPNFLISRWAVSIEALVLPMLDPGC